MIQTQPEAFGYCWHRSTGEFYYGIHSGSIDDDYAGSGTVFKDKFGGWYKAACKNPEQWNRTIDIRGSIEECAKWEGEVVTQQLVDTELCLNQMIGGYISPMHIPAIAAKVSKTKSGMVMSCEHKKALSDKKFGNSNRSTHNWNIKCPDGTEIIVENLNKFCKANKLSIGNMSSRGHTKGFRVIYKTPKRGILANG